MPFLGTAHEPKSAIGAAADDASGSSIACGLEIDHAGTSTIRLSPAAMVEADFAERRS